VRAAQAFATFTVHFRFFCRKSVPDCHYTMEPDNRAEAVMCTTDAECIEQCRNGRPDAFRQLLVRYERPLMAYLTRRLGDSEAAAEVAQESFVRAFFRVNTLNKQDTFFSWLLGIAHRVMLESFRRHHRERALSTAGDPADPGTLQSDDQDSELADAVAALPDIYREVTVLRYFGGLSCAEVGSRLGIPIGTTTKRLSRAYQILRQSLVAPRTKAKVTK
jgi:RNA polymerase sigma-70 factor (ECF subfamily)